MDLSATLAVAKSTPSKTTATTQMDFSTPSKPTPKRKPKLAASPPSMSPATPSTVRRSLRLLDTPSKAPSETPAKPTSTLKRTRAAPSPKTSTQVEPKRQRRPPKKRAYYRNVVYDGGEFVVGNNVYVKRRDGTESDAEEPEEEECRVCFRAGGGVMVECDVCLGGFHLRCVRPPLRRVPEGDWACTYCEAERAGRVIQRPKPPIGKSVKRTAKEKLLSSDLWAAQIER